MAKKNVITISIQKEMKDTAQALQKVTAGIFAGAPGVAAKIKGKRKSAQFTLRIRGANEKRSLASQARRHILGEIFFKRAPEIERIIKKALEAVIVGLVGNGNANVKVFGRSLGSAKPRRDIGNEPFARFIKSKAGAGEIGLPDPNRSIDDLRAALMASITVDVVVRKAGPQVRFSFDQRRLLKLTPHPDRLETGAPGPFFSWLSLVTGPDFVKGGTPGFSLVRVRDLLDNLRKSGTVRSSRQGSRRNLRRIEITQGLISASRTRNNAGELAGVMLKNRSRGRGSSTAEAFGGKSEDYRPDPQFNGFWDQWWVASKITLGTWTRRVIRAAVRELLRG